MRHIESRFATRNTEAKAAALYSALPSTVLSLSETIMQTAMGPRLRLGDQNDKSVWIRFNRTDTRDSTPSTMRSRLGQFSSTTRLNQSFASAVLGVAVYEDDRTRIDATLGAAVHEGRASGRGESPKVSSYSTAAGLILEHRTPVGLDVRVGTHYLGGYDDFRVPGLGVGSRALRKKFGHHAAGLRAEAGWRLPVGSGLTLTPQVAVSTNMAWVKQNNGKSERYTDTLASVSTRLSYSGQERAGRGINLLVEPTYISHLQRTHVDHSIDGFSFRVARRSPGDRAGLRMGADMPVGKNGTLGVSLSRFWAVQGGRRSESSASLSYTHRI